MENDVSNGRTPAMGDGSTERGAVGAGDGLARGDGSACLSLSTTTAMRRMLTAFREGWTIDGRVRETARLIAEDSRRGGLDAAHMIIAVRAVWMQLDELRRITPDDNSRALSGRLISCAIEEFYSPPSWNTQAAAQDKARA